MPSVIKLVAKPGETAVLRSVDGRVSLGDRSVFSHDLYIDGRRAGFDGGVSTIVRADGEAVYALCNFSMHLRDGTITFQALLEQVTPPVPFYTAITGGTGLYNNARGAMYVDPAGADEHYYRLYIETED